MALATQPFEGTEWAHSHGATPGGFLLAESPRRQTPRKGFAQQLGAVLATEARFQQLR
jgi:hypothetical protein